MRVSREAEAPWYDNAHLVYAAMREGKWFFVADGVEGPPHDRPAVNGKPEIRNPKPD